MAVAASSSVDLAALVREHSVFFDKLVDRVPPKFYLPVDDSVEQPWYGGMSKKQKLEARKKSKENLKKARRNRLDPKSFATTTELLEKREDAEKKEPPTAEVGTHTEEVDRAKTHQELKERLRKRIEAARAQRNAAKAKTAQDWQKRVKSKSNKRKEPASSQDEAPPEKRKKKAAPGPSSASENELEFGAVKIDSQQKRRKKQTKEKLLQQAMKLRSEMQDAEKGKSIATKHAWDAAVSRAAGEKVLDNPKLLKQSIKREQQRREKSAHKWQERQEAEKQRTQEKQQNRAAHIKERIDARKERAIAKREKKLMRPGFEGRKAGFLNG